MAKHIVILTLGNNQRPGGGNQGSGGGNDPNNSQSQGNIRFFLQVCLFVYTFAYAFSLLSNAPK